MDLTTTPAVERLVIALCVPLLIYIGYRLFVLGATGKMNLGEEPGGKKVNITNLAPGSLCFVLGLALGIWVMSNGVTGPSTTPSTPSNPDVTVSGVEPGRSAGATGSTAGGSGATTSTLSSQSADQSVTFQEGGTSSSTAGSGEVEAPFKFRGKGQVNPAGGPRDPH
jgi:hypothetical protein